MSPADCSTLLTLAAAFDNREPSEAAALAWSVAIKPSVTLDDAKAAVAAHYSESREWIMPVDVNDRVRDVRLARRDAVGPMPDTPPGKFDIGIYYRTWNDLALTGKPAVECYVRACIAAGVLPERLDRHGYTPHAIEACYLLLAGTHLPALEQIGSAE